MIGSTLALTEDEAARRILAVDFEIFFETGQTDVIKEALKNPITQSTFANGEKFLEISMKILEGGVDESRLKFATKVLRIAQKRLEKESGTKMLKSNHWK